MKAQISLTTLLLAVCPLAQAEVVSANNLEMAPPAQVVSAAPAIEYEKDTARFDRMDEGVPYGMNPLEMSQGYGQRVGGMGGGMHRIREEEEYEGYGGDRMRYGGSGGGGGSLGLAGAGIFGNGFGYGSGYSEEPHMHHHHHHHHHHPYGEESSYGMMGGARGFMSASNSNDGHYLDSELASIHQPRMSHGEPSFPKESGKDLQDSVMLLGEPHMVRLHSMVERPMEYMGGPNEYYHEGGMYGRPQLRGSVDREFMNSRMNNGLSGMNVMPLGRNSQLGGAYGSGFSGGSMNQGGGAMMHNSRYPQVPGGVGYNNNGYNNRVAVNPVGGAYNRGMRSF